jgi:hypothetical protein
MANSTFMNLALWCTPKIPALWRLKQEDGEFEASLGYTGRCFLQWLSLVLK